MATPRKYLVNLVNGHARITRTDGQDVDQEMLMWLSTTISRQLRTDHMISASGYQESAALLEENATSGESRRGAKNTIDPLVNELKGIIHKRGFSLAGISRLMGGRESQLSEWFRGQMKPTLRKVQYAFGLVGFHLVPIPLHMVQAIRDQVANEDKFTQETYDSLLEMKRDK